MNVLFIAVDDLSHTLGCYGHPIVQSPNVDRLASRGVRFDRAYCQFPVCNPSRTSLLTGLRPDTTGIVDNRTPFREKLPDVTTLPQLFRQNGYFTARIGKIYHGGDKFGDPESWDVSLAPSGTPRGRKGEGRNLAGGEVNWCRWMAAEGDDEDQPDGVMAAETIRLLEENRDRPFFIGLGFHKPHDPFVAPAKYFDLYPLDKLEPPTDPPDRSPQLPLSIGSGWKNAFDRFTDRDKREYLRAIYACVSFMDAQLGKVLTALDRLGLGHNTTIVFFGDHGYQLGQHGWWNKNTLYEPSASAPLIVAAPGVDTAGRSCNGIVEFLGIYPTLVDLCGLPSPDHLQGKSFRRLLEDPSLRGKEAAFTQVQRGEIVGRSVRTDRWRYTEWDAGRRGAELYDHRNDPGEYYNLAGDAESAEVVEELKKLLRK